MSTWVCKNNLMKGSQMNTPATRRTSEPIDFNASQACQNLLETTFRNRPQQMLQRAIEDEVTNYLHQHRDQRDLSDRQYVYLWADGIYFNVRLTSDRPCLLVLVGAGQGAGGGG